MSQPHERRQFHRIDISHPIRFKFFTRDGSAPASGYLQDISLGGVRIALDDPYGRIAIAAAPGARCKLEVVLPDQETLRLVCEVSWAKRRNTPSAIVDLGLEFQQMEDWQLQKIQSFMGTKHTDQTMFWHLWDAMQSGSR